MPEARSGSSSHRIGTRKTFPIISSFRSLITFLASWRSGMTSPGEEMNIFRLRVNRNSPQSYQINLQKALAEALLVQSGMQLRIVTCYALSCGTGVNSLIDRFENIRQTKPMIIGVHKIKINSVHKTNPLIWKNMLK